MKNTDARIDVDYPEANKRLLESLKEWGTEHTPEQQCSAPIGCVFEVERFHRHHLHAKCLNCGETITAHFLRDALQEIAVLKENLQVALRG